MYNNRGRGNTHTHIGRGGWASVSFWGREVEIKINCLIIFKKNQLTDKYGLVDSGETFIRRGVFDENNRLR